MPGSYFIQIQQRTGTGKPWYDGGVQYAFWPILFETRQKAEQFMRECFTFKNLPHKKGISAAVVARSTSGPANARRHRKYMKRYGQ